MTFVNPRVMLECQHVQTCLSDYWGGHHLPHLQIPVYRNMPLKEIKAALREELRGGVVAGSTDEALILSGYPATEGSQKRYDHLLKAAMAAVNRIKPEVKGQRTFFGDLDPETEDSPTVFAFFALVDITPEHMKRVYWLHLMDAPVGSERPFLTRREAVGTYTNTVNRRGSSVAGRLYIAEQREDIDHAKPDYNLRAKKFGRWFYPEVLKNKGIENE